VGTGVEDVVKKQKKKGRAQRYGSSREGPTKRLGGSYPVVEVGIHAEDGEDRKIIRGSNNSKDVRMGAPVPKMRGSRGASFESGMLKRREGAQTHGAGLQRGTNNCFWGGGRGWGGVVGGWVGPRRVEAFDKTQSRVKGGHTQEENQKADTAKDWGKLLLGSSNPVKERAASPEEAENRRVGRLHQMNTMGKTPGKKESKREVVI